MNSRAMRVRIWTIVALSAVAASTAGAQTPMRRAQPATRIPVTKQPPARDTAAPPPPATVVETPPPAPAAVMTTTTTTTTQPPMRMRRYPTGWYIGFGGGAGVPTGGIRDAYNTGYSIAVPIGWQSWESPVGFRIDLGYTRLGARTAFRNTSGFVGGPSGTGTLALQDPQMWSALANLKLTLARGWLGNSSSIYAVGGGGVNHFRHYDATFARTNPEFNSTTTASSQSLTRGALDGGGGVAWGWRNAEVFLESRYVTAFMPHERASYVPIILGVNFY